MTTYSIYFENKYGSTQNYAFFCEAPAVTSNTGKPQVFSNVFLSQSVALDGNWTIDITKTYFAWCGTAPATLAPGVKVTNGNGKLAALGTDKSPGTTWTMINNGGTPAFEADPTYTANPGAFEIDTNTDFTDNQNFLIGLGAVDGNGRMKPVATMEAPRNAIVNIAPVTKFYISSFATSVGTVINTTTASKKAALIDFTANPGLFGATVVQDADGKFTVSYYAHSNSFANAVSARKASLGQNRGGSSGLSGLDAEVKLALERVLRLFDSNSGLTPKPIYRCSVMWDNNPTFSQAEQIYKSLRGYMEDHQYTYFTDKQPSGGIEIWFQHGQSWSLDQASSDWLEACRNLGDLRAYCERPRVTEDPNAAQTVGRQAQKLLGINGGAGLSNGRQEVFAGIANGAE